MLNCKDVVQRASALIDGELSLWEVIRIRLHMALCTGCSAFVRQMQVTRGLTAIADAPSASDDESIAAILKRHHADRPAGE